MFNYSPCVTALKRCKLTLFASDNLTPRSALTDPVGALRVEHVVDGFAPFLILDLALLRLRDDVPQALKHCEAARLGPDKDATQEALYQRIIALGRRATSVKEKHEISMVIRKFSRVVSA